MIINLVDIFSCGFGFDFNNGPNRVSRFRRILPQFLASQVQSLNGLDMGLMLAISSIVVPSLLGKSDELNPDESLRMTPDEVSWLASILYIVQPIGNLLSGVMADSLGRKNTSILVSVLPMIAWFVLANANTPAMVYIGFSLLGIWNGLSSSLFVYLSETCEASTRGVLSAFSGIAVNIGMFSIFLLGSMLSWRTVAYISTIVPIANILVAILIPETPIWLLSKQKFNRAEKSLQVLRGWVSRESVATELNQLKVTSELAASCASCEKSKSKCTHPPPTLVDKLRDMTRKRIWKPFLLISIMFLFMQFSGMFAMRPYIVPILNAHGIALDANRTTVILGILGVLSNIFNVLFIQKIGKRTIYLYSMAGNFIACFGLSIYGWALFPSNWLSADMTEESEKWIREYVGGYNYFALAMFVLMQFCISVGVSFAPYMMSAEVFPFKSRTFCCSLAGVENQIFAFVATKIYYDLERWFSLPGVICFYGIIALIGFILTYFMLPETESVALEDIELHFSDNNRSIFDINIKKKSEIESKTQQEKC